MKASTKFGRTRVLIVGCGDVGLRCAMLLRERFRVLALTSQPQRRSELRSAGVLPIVADLDQRQSLARLAGLASHVLHLAPPQAEGDTDRRTQALLAVLGSPRRLRAAAPHAGERQRHTPRHQPRQAGVIVTEQGTRPISAVRPMPRRRPVLVYASTTGVYGDCAGARIDETRPVRPATARARRRVAAERELRRAGARAAVSARIIRIPGIYALERLPLERLRKGLPALLDADDVYTSHIHADDLAAIMVRAMLRGRTQRVVHAVDDTQLKMADYFDLVAQWFGLPPSPRISRMQAERELSALTLSFMSESRRLSNDRLKRELRYRLQYPTVEAFLRSNALAGGAGPAS